MPRVGLTLPDDLHAELVEAAARNRRSLNGEMLYRLSGAAEARTSSDASPSAAATTPRVIAPEDHFKPDPKPGGKK